MRHTSHIVQRRPAVGNATHHRHGAPFEVNFLLPRAYAFASIVSVATASAEASARRRYRFTTTALPTKTTEPASAIPSGTVPSGRGTSSEALASSF